MNGSDANAIMRMLRTAGIGRRALAKAAGGGAVAGLVTLLGFGRAAAARHGEESHHPAIIALDAVLADAAARLEMPAEEIAVQSLEAHEWRDGCLGLGLDGEACAEVITPGYRIVLGPPAERLVYRTDQQGTIRRESAEEDEDRDDDARDDEEDQDALEVHYEMYGGHAGERFVLELSTADLPDAEAEELRRLVVEADFWDLPEEIGEYAIDDAYEYTVTVSDGSRRHTVKTYDGNEESQARYPGFWDLLLWLFQRLQEE